MLVLKCFLNKIVRFTFANFYIWHQCSRKAGAVSLVLFDPFYTMEAHNNVVILHLLHAAAVENAPPLPPCQYLPCIACIRDDLFTQPDHGPLQFKKRPF